MKNNIRLFAVIVLLISSVFVYAQDDEKLTNKTAKELLDKAEVNFEEKNYIDALDKFKQLHDFKPSDLYYKLMMGICYTYSPEEKTKAIEIIEQVKITNPEYNLVNFYLAKAYAVNYDFDKAVNLFNMYLAGNISSEEEEKGLALQMIQNCKNAKEILADTITQNIVENVKYPINSQYSEYVPVISADESVMIFTYRGIKSKGADKVDQSMGSVDYNEDVFISYKKNGDWTEPVSIGDNINTDGHDAAIALSVDGQTLFIYKSEDNNLGDIYVSQLKGSNWSKPERIKGDVNKNDSWEGSASLSANGKVLYFASDREGGRGGRDLYKAELQSDGSWGNVQNLGYTINTAYNDDAPFIHPDNQTLYFSSEGHTSIGGYDIFYSKLDEYGSFGEALNIGYPINTIDDNRYFVLAADGKTGYYSGGGENSIGEQDIFKIITGKVGKPVLALLLGNVYFNDVATGSFLNLYRADNGEMEGNFKSNSESGKYVMALTPGRYEIEVELETGEIVRDSINLEEITEYIEMYKDFRIYSDSNLLANNNVSLQKALDDALKGENNKTIDTLFTDNVGKPKDVKPLDAGRSFKLENIFYDFDKSTLRAESKKELNHLVAILKENTAIKVEISSHTDASRNVEMAKKIFARRGLVYSKEAHDKMSRSYNEKLSQRRAQSVVDYLIANGIPKSRLVAKGYGESKPVATNDTDEGKQQNRRTEFKVLGN
ncbi:OmpA family protein [Vicingus serpentipes]|uniref:OmpA family protein n=1 Tax=Vicingus serpentipes TaxID=1926625 RepID=A0A5C6RVS7_9FLAO|nr:OmpA family protein [Vicingus serpentipes]TXB65989.1 OmpA family protein [Vicingus serpentipes]